MHQTVDAAEVDEHTVRSDVLDRSFEHLSFLQAAYDHALLLFEFCLDECFVRYDDVLELLVDFDNLEFHLLTNVNVEIANRLHIHLGTWQERLNSEDVYNETTFGAALHIALDNHVLLLRLIDLIPSTEDAGSAVRNHQLAILILLALHENRNDIAFLQVGVVSEFARADDAF